MLLINARFHIDSEVEINAATEDAYKAVLFKKKGKEHKQEAQCAQKGACGGMLVFVICGFIKNF